MLFPQPPLLMGALLVLLTATTVQAKNMNDGTYLISNAIDPSKYSTEYTSEYFDVYTRPIRSKYSEVYWTGFEPTDMPADVVKRFENKTMAIVGYEVDQVRVNEKGEEVPVPITHAYNHHYSVFIVNSRKGKVVKKTLSEEELAAHPHRAGMSHGSDHYYEFQYHEGVERDALLEEELGAAGSPGQFFSEANGGEMRLSYHGYPKGYAQLIYGPDKFAGTPMQIDTWNREHGDTPQFHPGPLPKVSPQYGNPNAIYSGLLECPCSTRRHKHWGYNYKLLTASTSTSDNVCDANNGGGSIQNATECWAGAQVVVPIAARVEKHIYQETDNESGKPMGCSLNQRADGVLDVYWKEPMNGEEEDAIEVAAATSVVGFGSVPNAINATVKMDATNKQVTLTLVGPADKWFGMGFGSTTMCKHMEADECPDGGPYAIIVYNDTHLEERKLDFHGPGKVLPTTVKVVSNVAAGGNRTVVLTRPLQGTDDRYFTFDATAPKLDSIMARGCSTTFAQHCGHGATTLHFVAVDTPMQICRDGISGGFDGGGFGQSRCAPFPQSTLLEQHNPTCQIQTYTGGLTCCKHGQSLLDEDQEIPWADQSLEYRLKFRYYFEEYEPATKTKEASHLPLARLYWQTEAFAGEYDITPCPPGTPSSQCIQVITSRWKVQNMLQSSSWGDLYGTGPNSEAAQGIELINAMPHCHAPSCLSMELYNADTGELLCHMEPVPGKSHDKIYDEFGYLAIPPCLWSRNPDDGLMEPIFLPTDTTLLSIKRNNNTLAHFGEMASWQMRGVVLMHKEGDEEESHAEAVNQAAKQVEEGEKASDKPTTKKTSLRKERPEV